MLKCKGMIGLLATSVALSACSSVDQAGEMHGDVAQPGDELDEQRPGLGDTQNPGAAAPITCNSEVFDVGTANLMLREATALSEFVGLTDVTSCADADAFTKGYEAYLESLEQAEEAEQAGPGIEVFNIASAASTNLTKKGVLEIGDGDCTGVAIADDAFLTAAHCFDGDTLSFDLSNYHVKDFGGAEADVDVRVYIHDDYTGSGDVGDDLALVKILTSTYRFPVANRYRISTGHLFETATMYGRGYSNKNGTGSGTLRSMNYDKDESNEYYFRKVADTATRACKGDSGGPVIATNEDGREIVFGLHVQSDKTGSEKCAKSNGSQRAVRLQYKIGWIDDMLGGTDSDDCTFGQSDDGWQQWARCWD